MCCHVKAAVPPAASCAAVGTDNLLVASMCHTVTAWQVAQANRRTWKSQNSANLTTLMLTTRHRAASHTCQCLAKWRMVIHLLVFIEASKHLLAMRCSLPCQGWQRCMYARVTYRCNGIEMRGVVLCAKQCAQSCRCIISEKCAS